MKISRKLMLLTLLLLMVVPVGAATLAVVFPKVPPPHDRIFEQIIEGIEQEFDGKINKIVLDRNDNMTEVIADIASVAPDMVITLAKSGFKVAHGLQGKYPLVSGALPIMPNGIAGISPVADPLVMFNHLQQLAPEVKNVYVVYSPENQWLIDLAKLTAQSLKLNLQTYQVNDVQAAVKEYSRLLKTANIGSDAFWLPLDNVTANDKVVLPMLLEAAWEQKFVVFSSKPTHAKRGALFSMIPDNKGLGVTLVRMVKDIYSREQQPTVKPTTEVMLAVNLRTASHLGLEYTAQQKNNFNFTFPTQ